MLPGITTKSVMSARFLDAQGAVDVVKVVSGHELMLFVGWPSERLAELTKCKSSEMTAFAGAAFSGFALLPVFAAALFGAGKLGINGEPEQEMKESTEEAAELAGANGKPTDGKTSIEDIDSDNSGTSD